jgi:hypothetical protein
MVIESALGDGVFQVINATCSLRLLAYMQFLEMDLYAAVRELFGRP